MRSCLVICATNEDSACHVAIGIANTLRLHGAAVDVSCDDGSFDLEAYDAIVIGAPLRNGRWLRATRSFLKRNKSVLKSKDVALFALEPCRCEQNSYDRLWNRVIRFLTKLRWLSPVRIEVFPYESAATEDCADPETAMAIAKWCRGLEVSMHLADWDVSDHTGLV